MNGAITVMTSLRRLLFGDRSDPRAELEDAFGADHGVAWAQTIVASAGVDAADEVAVIRAIRQAERRLGLAAATHLAARVARA